MLWRHNAKNMNKKEVLEIKKLFTPENSVITRICGCYVDGNKEIKLKTREAFHSIPENDAFKYYEIFKHSLSGSIGKNLLNMDFPLESEKAGGTQEFLLRLRDSKLTDDTLTDEFFNKIIENYNYGENYYIILIHAVYDVPGKSSDGEEMFDSSDTVYDYILCSICPVELSDAGLSYHIEDNTITDRIRDWIVKPPAKAFLFPEFNDRASDIHSVLYYTKNPDDIQEGFIENVFGTSSIPLSAKAQSESFNTIVKQTLGEECRLETIQNIQESISEMVENAKENPEPLILKKSGVKRILENCGIEEEKLTDFDIQYDNVVGEKDMGIVVSNISNFKKFSIKSPDIMINVSPDKADLIETRIIDGKKYFLIPVSEDVTVNGVNVNC